MDNIRAHHAGVNKHTGQLIADRFMKQHRHHGAIHPTGKAADHFTVTNLLANAMTHTPPGTTVEVDVGTIRGEAVFIVLSLRSRSMTVCV